MFLANYSRRTDEPAVAGLHRPFPAARQDRLLRIGPLAAKLPCRVIRRRRRQRRAAHSKAGVWINGGFFVFRTEIFDYMEPGEELVEQPFQRLIDEQELLAYKYEGYWGSMDTFKEKQALEDLYSRGDAPWEVWKVGPSEARPATQVGTQKAGRDEQCLTSALASRLAQTYRVLGLGAQRRRRDRLRRRRSWLSLSGTRT